MGDDTSDTMPDLWNLYDLPFLREVARRIAGGERRIGALEVGQTLGGLFIRL